MMRTIHESFKRRTARGRLMGLLGGGVWLLMFLVSPVAAQAQSGAPRDAAPSQPADQRETAEDGRRVPADVPAGQPAKTRVDRLIESLDPAKVALTGADLEVEIIGDQLFLHGNEEDLDLIEALVAILEKGTEQKELRVVTVTERDAADVARTIQEAMRDVIFRPNQRPEDQVTVIAVSPTILLVSALPGDIDFVVDLIRQVDEVKDELGKIEQLVFPIRNRKAADVAEQLREILEKLRQKQGATGAEGEIQVVANNANNSIMVLAPESEREKLQRLINELDVEPVEGWGDVKLTLYPLLHSKANELADVINNLIASQEQREAAEEVIYRMSISKSLPDGELVELPPIDLQKPLRIIHDEGTNSLIVATVEENVGPMGELIRLMDGVPLAVDFDVRLFPLRFADAETVGDMLKQMFEDAKTLPEDPDGSGANGVPASEVGGALVYNVGIASDVRTNTLIVSGRPAQIKLAEKIVGELDRPATGIKFPLRVIPLEYTDASRLGDLITDLFDQRMEALQATNTERAALERERVFLSVDIRSNSLVVSVSEENYNEIMRIVRQLDTKPAQLFEQIRIVRCQRLAATDLKEKIDELWQRKIDLRREQELLEDAPVIVADERSNSLVVAASMEDFDEIKRLVETLESQPMIDDTRLFKLRFADATVVAGMLDELFDGMASVSEAFEAPTIIADPRSNTLVVAATRDGMERVEDLVGRLDVKAGPMTATFEVYTLEHASATKLAQRMQELFDSRAEGQEQTRTPIVILAEESSNSLVASASRDDHLAIVDLLELLDRPSNIAQQFSIFSLKMAKADTVAEKLEALFQSQAEGTTGRADAMAVEADERTNSIIVWASPTEMENIAEVIERLDTSTPAVEMMVKVIQLKQALAEDFTTLLEETFQTEGGDGEEKAVIINFEEVMPDGTKATRKLLHQDIRIKPDPRTNSLMVMAPASSMAMLEAMIRDFDRIRPIRSEIRLFPLVNSDAETMEDKLRDLFAADEGGDGEAKSQLVFGSDFEDQDFASVGQELRFASDPRTNTLIAAGAEVDLQMVADLVYYLDSQEAETRVVEVVPTKFRDAQDLATAIQGFNDQEQNVLSEGDDEESRMRRMERQISVEAIGGAEEGSSSLIIGTSKRAYNQTMEMISRLDRPEPQVRISVLIAEVTLSDALELGIEIAGQDLHFTEDAFVLEPNGVIQGSQFDYVLGTDLGAAGLGLGGLNFTVGGEDFSFLLHALQTNSRLNVMSRPTLTVRNGEEGKITVADEVPFVERSNFTDSGQTQSTIGSEDVGIVLTATPRISPDGYVTIELVQEISSFSGENVQLSEGVSSPIFSTREVDTNVTVRDGETVVVGGLIQERDSDGENKVPLLGDLPWIGPLFRSVSVTHAKTELLVVLTVEVIHDDEEMYTESVRQRDLYHFKPEELQNPLWEGLRIRPDETTLGPDKEDGGRPTAKPRPGDRDKGRQPSPPEPGTYGPVIEKPPPKTTKTSAPSFGPRIAKKEEMTQG